MSMWFLALALLFGPIECPAGCIPDPNWEEPPASECCWDTGACSLVGNTLSSNGDMDTTLCEMPADLNVILAGTWTYNAPQSIASLSCSGTSTLNPQGNGDLNLRSLVMNDCSLGQVGLATMEFFLWNGVTNITGSGSLDIYRVEHESGSGPNFLGSITFGTEIFDITGAFVGAHREYILLADMVVPNIFLMEKNTRLDLADYELVTDRFRSKGDSIIEGNPGARLIVGTGVPLVPVSGTLNYGNEWLANGTYVWQ